MDSFSRKRDGGHTFILGGDFYVINITFNQIFMPAFQANRNTNPDDFCLAENWGLLKWLFLINTFKSGHFA